MYKTTGANRPL